MNVNIVLFDDFETMDAFGPAQIFGKIPEHFHLNYLSVNGGIINSSQGVKVWTEILIPREVEDILLVPGGRGARKVLCLEQEMLNILKESAKEASACMMIGNGSAVLAQTGLLYRRRIADYPGEENWKRMFTAGIVRESGAGWVSDGKYYSSSCTMAGIDMTLGVISDLVDPDVAVRAARSIGYDWDQQLEYL
ncbi:MAG: DJ-1/PfpI family protein [Lachnospiraceae bacterium]|nr:DJ-1/PfpI family protein [Lachnospiraceae bacterium]